MVCIFQWCESEVPGCHLLRQMSSQRGSQKLLQEPTCLTVYLSVFDIFLTHWIMAILSKRCKRENFESQNFLKLSFTNILGFRSNFGEWKSFFESNSPHILALCETNFYDSIHSGNFSVIGYLPLICNDSITHVHDLAVYVKKGLPFTWELSPENSMDS